MKDFENLVNEAFENSWDGEEWKKEQEREVFIQGFCAGVTHITQAMKPYLESLSKQIEILKKKSEDRSE